MAIARCNAASASAWRPRRPAATPRHQLLVGGRRGDRLVADDEERPVARAGPPLLERALLDRARRPSRGVVDDDRAALVVEAHDHHVVVAAAAHLPGHDQRTPLADELAQVRHVALVGDRLEATAAGELGQPGAGDPVQLGREQGARDVVVGRVVAPIAQYHDQGGGAARVLPLSDERHFQGGRGEDRDEGENHRP